MTSDLAVWKKSPHSGAEGDCVEVAVTPEFVGVRDSKDREGGVLVFPKQQWAGFVAALRRS
ncbi:DUF397 domain-containing protein [Saccharopolyspora rhizosphaerae]|uniref:DUF397 domain-containing protein n=1 Tax=Saccharopolyspora rhizosphaerae TaxID=2492662 RepID=A0A3R8PY67_9PSEU|nr:DUF397 domain-containing protein [Saccharopolyspora rhizosphaerae]RRO12929.1 DUF397 domain-containing protein [Saccharopolyspora rhizosphaerae]